jgi:CRP-like cAMP-binding protein
MKDKFWYLKSCDLFERLTPEQIARLEARSRSRTFARGSLVYLPAQQNDSVLLLASGRIKLYHNTSDGKQAVLALVEPGELFGELAILDRGLREEFAEAVENSTVVLIPAGEIQRLMETHPRVSLEVTRLMGLRRQRVERRLKSLLFHSNRERLVHLLLELVEQYGRSMLDGVSLGIKLSHQDLASMIGSTRETVTVLLGELQAEGSIIVRRRQILLTQMELLARAVGVNPPQLHEREDLGTRLLRQAEASP